MKRLLFLILPLLCTLGLRAETIDLGEFGRLSFTVDASAWKVASANMNDGTFEVMISPRNGANAYAGFTISLRPGLAATSRERLQAALVADSREEATGSVERRVDPKEFAVKSGFGYSADFTDRTLVGRATKKGDFKAQTKVMLALAEMIGVSGSVASGGFDDPVHQQLLGIFRSMEVLPAAAKK
jgi:hypothetical protein